MVYEMAGNCLSRAVGWEAPVIGLASSSRSLETGHAILGDKSIEEQLQNTH